MTVTETRPETSADVTDLTPAPLAATGLAAALGTGDHKALGRMYVLLGIAGGIVSLVLTLLVQLERLDTDSLDILTFGSADQFFQTWSLAQTSLLFFCVLPLMIGLATYVVPLQVGAPSIAFPRAAAAAFWGWLIAIVMHVVTVFSDGGLGAFFNLGNTAQGEEAKATELSLLSIGMVVIAILLASVCIVTTIIAQRPQGMTLMDVPLFSWSMLVACGVWLLAFPVWLANLAVIWVDFRGSDAIRTGRVDQMWEQLDWLWSQPMVFVFAVPLLGIIGDIVPTSAGVRQKGYATQQVAIGALGVLSFGAFVQPFFNADVKGQIVYAVMSLLLVLPILVFFGGIATSLKDGKVKPSGHLAAGIFAVLVLLLAAVAAAMHAGGTALGALREFNGDPLDGVVRWFEDLEGTVIATGVMQLALLAALIGAVAGIYYWAPKMFGRQLNSGIGGLVGLSLFGGAALLGLSNVVNGILDEGNAVFSPLAYNGVWDRDAVELVNIVGLVGSILVIAGLGLLLLDLFISAALGKGDAENADDPFDGHTLEWATDSPPPAGNFASAPVVHSERPLLDMKEAE